MLSSCMRGQTGPERRYSGFGAQGAALAGMVAITGWPDRMPSGPFGAYTDFIAPRYSLAALGAAIHHRDRTGQGQYVDLSQIEAAIHFVEPLVLDYTVNGRVAHRAGHDSERACPHGVYRATGVERYVAIAVETPEQWRALCAQAPPLRALEDPALEALPARIEARTRIDALLAEWCRAQEPFGLARSLRKAGVPAYVVQRGGDLHQDPQLAHREFFVKLDHPQIGPAHYDGLPTRFSETPGRLRNAGPTIGQDTWYVLRELLHLEDERISELAAAGVLS
jgi:benzylsuccinate CoA-transferase BbsF subunit